MRDTVIAGPDRLQTPDPSSTGPSVAWADGEIQLRLHGAGSEPERVRRIRRPFALIGRLPPADLRIVDPALSARHVYLHLDAQGLFGVDLASRTGTRCNGAPWVAGWLRPGDVLEAGGQQIEILGAYLQGANVGHAFTQAGPEPPDPLDEAGDAHLAELTLFPGQPPWEPRAVRSRFLFLGRGSACGLRIDDPQCARIHAVLVRSSEQAHVVDLVGRQTTLRNDQVVPRVAPLARGDTLTVGSSWYQVRVVPVPPQKSPRTNAPLPPELPASPTELVPTSWPWHSTPERATLPAWPSAPVSPEAQGAVLGWLVQAVHAGQVETLRRQDEFQNTLVQMIRQICLDNADLLGEHLRRMEQVNQELADLRDEIRRRLGNEPPPPPSRPKPPPLRIAPVEPSTDPADPERSTTWLLERVQNLEAENRSTWKELLQRLGGSARQAP